MPNFYYIDANGQKQGLVTEQQLQALAAQGVIAPNTPMETEGGHKGLAEQIPGLKFNVTAMAQVTQQRRDRMSSQTDTSVGLWAWLLDFAFHDIRLPIINLWLCRIIYAISCVCASIVFCFTVITAFVAFFHGAVDLSLLWLFIAFVCVPLFVIGLRMVLEWEIMLLDWVVASTKAHQIFIEQNK